MKERKKRDRTLYNQQRKKRYHEDDEYAEQVKERVRAYRERLKDSRRKRRVILIKSFVDRLKAKGLDDQEVAKRLKYLGPRPMPPIVVEFGNYAVRLLPISVLGAELGFSQPTIRKWHRLGVIPEPVFRDDSDRRWYSDIYLGVLRDAVRAMRHSENSRWDISKFKKEVDSRWRKRVVRPHKNERKLLASLRTRRRAKT
jgi:hypothetical protein